MKKLFIALAITLAASALLSGCTESGNGDTDSTTTTTTLTTTTTTTNKSDKEPDKDSDKECKEHSFGEWSVLTNASCSKKGERSRKCSLCGHTEKQDIDKLAHTPVTDEGKAPTCTEAGLTEGSHCSVCSGVLVAQTEIPRNGHSYGADELCAVCGSERESLGLKFTVSGELCWVAGIGECTDTVIYIPREHDGYIVHGISGYAFKDCTTIEKVVMQDNIKVIGEEAFKGCVSLADVVMSPSVFTINSNTFNGCTKLYSIDISSIKFLKHSAFAGSSIKKLTIKGNTELEGGIFEGSMIEEVVFESGITSVPSSTFRNTARLKSVTLPEGITTIGNSAFSGSAIESITLPSTLKTLSGSVFSNCVSLKSIDFSGASVKVSYSKNFAGCTLLASLKNLGNISGIVLSDIEGSGLVKEQNGLLIAFNTVYAYNHDTVPTDLVIPEGVSAIESNVFENCKVIFSITFPSTLKSIGDAAFKGFESEVEFVLPEGLTAIGNDVFADSDATYIYLPDSLTYMTSGMLRGCYSLETISIGTHITKVSEVYASSTMVIFRGTSKEYNDMIGVIGQDIFTTNTISCKDKDIIKVVKEWKHSGGAEYVLYSDGLLTVTGEGEIPYVNPDIVIKSRAKKLVISEGITKFAESFYSNGAFEGFSSLTEVEIPSTLIYIGNTFARTPWYEAVKQKETVIISGDLLVFASGLEGTYTVPNGIVTIGDGAFQCSPNLKKIVFGSSVKTIGRKACYECTSLEEAVIPEGVEFIGQDAFARCHALKELTIPSTVKSIDHIVSSCGGLKKITIVGGDQYVIGGIASYCSALECVIIGNGVTELPINTLYDCATLKYVVIPESVTSVNHSAFWSGMPDALFLCIGKDTADHMNGLGSFEGKVYLYSESEPSEEGLFWGYDDDGEIIIY